MKLNDSVVDFEEKNVGKDYFVETGEGFGAMRDVVAASVSQIIDNSFSLPTRKTIVLGRDRQIVELLYDLYGNLDRMDEFIIDNNINPIKISGQFADFEPTNYLDPKEAKRMDRFIQFAMVASEEAVKDANLTDITGMDPYRIGVIVSTAAGGYKTFEENHLRIIERGQGKCSPFTVPMMIVNRA